MKKALSLILSVLFVISAFTFTLSANENPCGKCGENITWTLSLNDGVLEISGTGEMYDYTATKEIGFITTAPWFEYRKAIKTVVISDAITNVGDYAFGECKDLSEVNLPQSITKIGDCAFQDCLSLSKINIPNGIEEISTDAFYECTALTYNEYDTAMYLGTEENPYLFLAFSRDVYIEGCEVNADTKYIADYAFMSCYSLKNITIPDSVTAVGAYAFNDCNALKYTPYENGCYLGNAQNPYLYFAETKDTEITEININSDTKIIGYSAFYDCCELRALSLPFGVCEISYKMFYNCKNLRSVFIPDSVKSIKAFAFFGCEKLESVSISDNLAAVGTDAFFGCSSLEFVRYFGRKSDFDNVKIKGGNNEFLSAKFKFDNEEKSLPFSDVQKGTWYYDAVAFCYENKILVGKEDGNFYPEFSMTREELTVALFNMSGEDKIWWQGESGFCDVPENMWYSPAVKWAKENEIICGIDENVFGIGERITREQTALILRNYAKKSGLDTSKRADLSRYADSGEISDWAYEGMSWAVAEGIIKGTTETALSPREFCNRASIAMIIGNYSRLCK